MRYITLDDGGWIDVDPKRQTIAQIDLGEPNKDGDYENGDLAVSSGNLYIRVDGIEWGSLYFRERDGQFTISLGQYDPWEEQWVDRSPLIDATETERDPEIERLIEAAASWWHGGTDVNPKQLDVQVDMILVMHPTCGNREWVQRQIRSRIQVS